MGASELIEILRPVASTLAKVALDDPAAACAVIERELPSDGKVIAAVRAAAEAGAEAGWLLPKEMGGIRFGRVAKDLEGFSVDAVWSSGDGPRHRHPSGEIDLLFAIDGTPTFDGHAPGWAAYAPGSEHMPGVNGGTMLILYFLPGGAIEWT